MKDNPFVYAGAMLFIVIVIAAVCLASPGLSFPIEIWDGRGEIVAMHEHEGHSVFHVRALEETSYVDENGVIELVNTCLSIAGGVEQDHGLYIVVEAGETLAFALGLTQNDALAWQRDPDPMALDYIVNGEFGLPLRWPSWVPDETIVWGYAWMLGAKYYDKHTWYPALAWQRPLPLDSDFVVQRKE